MNMFTDVNEKILYKYRPARPIEQVHRLLSSGELWFSSAKSFNDPFDTAITYNFDGADSPIAEKWAVAASKRHMAQNTKSERDRFVAKKLRQIRNDPEYVKKERKRTIEQNYQEFGICSLGGSNDSLLMWAHYADKHMGLCVGLSVEVIWKAANSLAHRDQALDLVKVTYSDAMPKINFFEAMLDEDDEHVMQFVRTKSGHWSYENEHRLVFFKHPNTSFTFGSELIAEVVFGCRMPESERNALVDFCRRCLPHGRLFEANADEDLFRLKVVPV